MTNQETLKGASRGAMVLAGFALIGTALLAITHAGTEDRIAANERAAFLASFNKVIPAIEYDNDPLMEIFVIPDSEAPGKSTPAIIYRASKAGEPVGLFVPIVAPDGYGGPIHLLLGLYADGGIAGLRVTRHRETPGLGDALETERSDWILRFSGRFLGDPPLGRWKVRKDGGDFDQFTGATITPRAVVNAVRPFLVYFGQHPEWFDHRTQ